MEAYHNDESIKQKCLQRLEEYLVPYRSDTYEHYFADLKNFPHCLATTKKIEDLEKELGFPIWFCEIMECLFRVGVKKDAALFIYAINVGADLDKNKKPFFIYLSKKLISYLKIEKENKDITPDHAYRLNRIIKQQEKNIVEFKKGIFWDRSWHYADHMEYVSLSARSPDLFRFQSPGGMEGWKLKLSSDERLKEYASKLIELIKKGKRKASNND